MGAAAGTALAKATARDTIISFLDDWSSVATCDTSDIANMDDVEWDITSLKLVNTAPWLNLNLYEGSMEYPFNGVERCFQM